jgi:vanillate O-demethylase ferredoxin subunit
LSRTGAIVHVPADRTALDVLTEHGVAILSSCGQGLCGTCATRVLDGVPDHRDSYLTAQERERGDIFTPCCSRARTPVLVLDL